MRKLTLKIGKLEQDRTSYMTAFWLWIRQIGKRRPIPFCRICIGELDRAQPLCSYLFSKEVICHVCKETYFHCIYQKLTLSQYPMWALYTYDDALESLIYRYKEQRDIALAPVFLHDFRHKIERRYAAHTIVTMPSSEAKIKERGFHHLEEMLKEIRLPICPCLRKTAPIKQAKQGKKRRLEIAAYIELDPNLALPDTALLLFDDVCTSGSTLRAACELLKQHPYPIEVLVLSVHPLYVENCGQF
ncbi:ComF family protein [Massilicoli timonensis]|uniref:ComF family protein n=1 Tax=Massilicoli timonensis TaxID=2015901 RepID=A0ABT1SN65_9FIRM|nr:ComF family protein [Massilicoli timonensis]MCQ5122661.1 ComF family protein [Massilicoli timonensis]